MEGMETRGIESGHLVFPDTCFWESVLYGAVWLLFSSQLILKRSTSTEVLYRFGIKENYHEVLEKKHLESSWKETPKQVMPSYISYL